MKKLFFALLTLIAFTACQKTVNSTSVDRGTENDTSITATDTLTYEVITSDPKGWFGLWNNENGVLESNRLDSGSYGSPIYFQSGWRKSFVPKTKPYQLMMSVAAFGYSANITINLYKNNKLIRSTTGGGVAKTLLNALTEEEQGTAAKPVVSYEVLVNNMDTTKNQYDGWTGVWTNEKGVIDDNRLLFGVFAIPSGYKYHFVPEQLPYTISLSAGPYTKQASDVTVNMYVNGQLVKTQSTNDWIYNMNYTLN